MVISDPLWLFHPMQITTKLGSDVEHYLEYLNTILKVFQTAFWLSRRSGLFRLPSLGVKLRLKYRSTFCWKYCYFPAGIYLFKVHTGNTRTMFEICEKLTLKIPGRLQWRRSGVFIVNFEKIHLLFCYFHCWLWLNKRRLGWFKNEYFCCF